MTASTGAQPRIQGLGARLQIAREAKGWTQRQLSERVEHFGASSICQFEREDLTPTLFRLAQLATALGVSTDWLLGMKEDYPLPIESKLGRLDPETRVHVIALVRTLVAAQEVRNADEG